MFCLLTLLRDGIVVIICLASIVTDWRWRRIPNWLTFPAIGCGLLLHGLEGWEGLVKGVAGLAFSLLIMLPFFALDMLKAGDVKLVVAWGALKGIAQPIWHSFFLWAFLYGAVLGGLWAIFLVLRAKATGITGQRILSVLFSLGAVRLSAETSPLRTPMPYGVSLSIGGLLALVMEWWLGHPSLMG